MPSRDGEEKENEPERLGKVKEREDRGLRGGRTRKVEAADVDVASNPNEEEEDAAREGAAADEEEDEEDQRKATATGQGSKNR